MMIDVYCNMQGNSRALGRGAASDNMERGNTFYPSVYLKK